MNHCSQTSEAERSEYMVKLDESGDKCKADINLPIGWVDEDFHQLVSEKVDFSPKRQILPPTQYIPFC